MCLCSCVLVPIYCHITNPHLTYKYVLWTFWSFFFTLYFFISRTLWFIMILSWMTILIIASLWFLYDACAFSSAIDSFLMTRSCVFLSHVEEQLRPQIRISTRSWAPNTDVLYSKLKRDNWKLPRLLQPTHDYFYGCGLFCSLKGVSSRDHSYDFHHG